MESKKISASDVGKLRKITGSGMLDCKNSLIEANGDLDKAIEILRKKGQKVANKRADRETSEGFVLAYNTSDNSFGAILSLNCETDFVAKNQRFVDLAKKIMDISIKDKPNSLNALLGLKIDSLTVSQKIEELIGVIGEKISLEYYETISGEYVKGYTHQGNKIASMVCLSKKDVDNIDELAKDLAMQVAAMNPMGLDDNSIPKNIIEKEMEIVKEQLKKENKPDNIIDKISQGKLNKFFAENTLLKQSFIKDNKISIERYVKSFDGDLKIKSFKRYSIS